MSELFLTKPGRFKLVAAIEGISFLVLLGIAMPLKYVWGQPWMVQNVGMLHGVFFVLYVLQVLQLKDDFRWSLNKTFLALAGGVLPFGTFYVSARLVPAVHATDPEVEN